MPANIKDKNVIPRKFNCIIGRMLIPTNVDVIGDILYIKKDEHGYLAFNTRTNTYARMFVEMLRNKQCFEILKIE